ncbi:MAG: glycosyltransferase [Deltaproteobacteria bacterium]|nr:glycosyltransferase [Deltaproteobacteria bacterium]
MSMDDQELLRAAMLAVPDRLSSTDESRLSIPLAFWLVDALQPKVVVEVGGVGSDFYFGLCQAVEAARLVTACSRIALTDDPTDAQAWADDERYNRRKFGRMSRLVQTSAERAQVWFADGSIDLLHLRSLGRSKDGLAELARWRHKLSPRAVVLIEGIGRRGANDEVWRHWERLSSSHPHFALMHGAGLGVLAVGPDAGRVLSPLASADDALLKQLLFARLGDAVAAHGRALAESGGLAAAPAEIRKEVEDLRASLGAATATRLAQEAELRAGVVRVAGLQEDLEGQGRLVGALQEERNRLSTLVHRVQSRSLLSRLRDLPLFLPLKLVLWLLTGRLRRELRRRREIAELLGSRLFDVQYYLGRHPEVPATPFAAAAHSLEEGPGRNPNAWFDSDYYRGQSPDVAKAGINPLLHFVRHGAAEGRDPHPFFSTPYYVANSADVAAAGVNPLLHFIEHGLSEGRRPHPSLANATPRTLELLSLGHRPRLPAPTAAALPEEDVYQRWIREHDTLKPSERALLLADLELMRHKPLISIVMPTYNSEEKWLRRAVETIRAQLYPNWELCISDDGSPEPHVRPLLEEPKRLDPRIKVTFNAKNGGISAASNVAIDAAQGEFIAFVDHDDEIPETALYYVAAELNLRPDADFLYSDQDKIDVNGKRFDPYFKPDFNPDLLRSQNYVDHLAVFRTALVRKLGKLRSEMDGSQDYDMVLRTIEATTPERVRHIPHVLYHWRAVPGSIAADENAKSKAPERSRTALRQHLQRSGIEATVTSDFPQYSIHRVVYPVPEPEPLVSIIVPTRDRLELLEPLVDDVLHRTNWRTLEVLIVDNDSKEPATLAYLERIAADPRVRVLKHPGKFDYSAINNEAVRVAKGSILAFLNNDLRTIQADWLREMVSHAIRPGVGAVGARLYYANDTVQHGGVFLGYRQLAGHLFRYARRESLAQWARCMLTQNLTAVTAACMVVRRETFEQVKGFSADFTVTFNDVDLCLRIRELGLRNVYAPHAELYHLESMTRGDLAHQHEEDLFSKRWADLIANDPAYNPNLTITAEDFSPAFPPRARQPWTLPLGPAAKPGKLVTIITRTHGDREQYLREALRSACRQTHRPLEVIVVEDGPTRAAEVIRALQPPEGVSLRLVTPGKVGRCVAGNAAMAASKGEYVCFLDDDDLLLPGHVARLARELDEHPEIAGAYSNAWELPTETRSLRPLIYTEAKMRLFQGRPFSLAALWDYNYVSIQSVMFRRALFTRLGGLDPDLDCLEDWDLWLRYSAESDFTFVNETTSLFRMPANPATLASRRDTHLRYLPIVRRRQRELLDRFRGTAVAQRLSDQGVTQVMAAHAQA